MKLNNDSINEVELTYVPKNLSGIDVIDKSWGGMYQGGSYLCYGHAASGRGLIGMLFLQTGVLLGEKGLFISTGRPHDWMIQAATVNFDLQEARDSGRVRLLWIPSSLGGGGGSLYDSNRPAEELIKMVRLEKPDRLLINDFSPFLKFSSFDQFQKSFSWLMRQLDELGDTTVLLMMPEAVNRKSRQIIDFMRNHMTGSIHVDLEEEAGSENRRKVTLIPGIGHASHEVFDHWKIPGTFVEKPDLMSIQPSPNVKADTGIERRLQSNNPLKAGSLAHIENVSTIIGDLSVPPVAVEALQKVELEHEIFCTKLRMLFDRRETALHTPFLLVALRVEPENAQVELDSELVFENVLSVMSEMIEKEDHLLIDKDRKRVITLLMDIGLESIKQVFELLQMELKHQSPKLADQLPDAISAVVVSDGHPFESPEGFLAYALEGD